MLGEYVLSLEPGFGLGTAIDDELLVWLSRVVQHEVNLYWGSEVYASSKRDLFTAGLLPRRIPGEIWERVALAGDGLAARTGSAGGAEYLELYAPLEVPGAARGSTRLFLAMPLLAQQEEAIAETGRIRRRALLATLALFLVLAATGTRLAGELHASDRGVRRRHAADRGRRRAPRLPPAELELEALAEAIDRMAASGSPRGASACSARSCWSSASSRTSPRAWSASTATGACCSPTGSRASCSRRCRASPLADRLAAAPRLAPVAAFLAGARCARRARRGAPGRRRSGEREWTLVWAPLEGPGEPEALLVVEDVTEIARGQRLEAWASMARIIAHEIKNPLTPIRLSAEHLREAWARDREHFAAVFDRCTDNILSRSRSCAVIASEFSTYSHVPRLERRPGDLVAVGARRGRGLPRGAAAGSRGPASQAAAEPLSASLRRRSCCRARCATCSRTRCGRRRGGARSRSGWRATATRRDDRGRRSRRRAWRPSSSSGSSSPTSRPHAGGTGLGLPIARRIAEEHGGSLTASNRVSGGLEAVITIPLG